MEGWLFKHSAWIYWGSVAAISLFLGIWEGLRPRRANSLSRPHRWLMNGFLSTLTDAITISVFRIGAVAVAFAVNHSAYGLLNRASLPYPVAVLLTFLMLDLTFYANHYLHHSVPLLWRFHQVHHSDHDVDFSTGLRFHPGDQLTSQLVYLLVVAILAPPPSAVAFFELANITQILFSHANLRLPGRIERSLGLVLVTPEFHRIHHSVDVAHQRSNLAVVFSFWDRLFRTRLDRAGESNDQMRFGLEEVTAAQSIQPLAMLMLPFASAREPRPQPQSALQTGSGKAS